MLPHKNTLIMTLNTPPGPKGSFLIGNLTDFTSEPLNFVLMCAREYGDIVSLGFGPYSVYLLSNPEHIDYVLRHTNQQFIKSQVLKSNKLVLGEGLLTSEGEFWHRQRRLAQPGFRRQQIAAYGDIMIAFADKMLSAWQDGEVHDVHADMMQLTLEIVAKCLFNADVAGEAQDVGAALNISLEHFNYRAKTLFLIPDSFPTPENLRFRGAVKQLDEIVYGIINHRRTSGENPADLLSMLMEAEDEDGSHMTDKQLRDEVMTLFLAGHETTANTLSWTWMLLSQHPEVQAKLQSELQTVLGGRNPTPGDQSHLPYTTMVITEAMRLYPPVWRMSREVVEDWQVGGYNLKAGTTVFMSQWVTHRNPQYFPEPETFNPDRWAGDFAKSLPPGVYFPFGGGPRVCIGQGFAMMEAVLLLATVAQRFELTLVPEHEIVLQPSITLRPEHGIKVLLRRR